MNIPLSASESDIFQKLLRSVKLIDIQTVKISFEKKTDAFEAAPGISMSWNQAFADGDPVKGDDHKAIFRPKYEFSISKDNQELFHQTVLFAVVFQVEKQEDYQSAWSNQNVKLFFLQKQVMRTLWPILRAQVMNGMNSLGLRAVPLPWIVE